MSKATKLPSGSWRARVYSHTDTNGVKHYESFTASTKAEAELLASKFSNDRDTRRSNDITVKDAVRLYIESNNAVLSPSTLRGYIANSKKMTSIEYLKIKKLTSVDIQTWISELTISGSSPKSIKNIYGLLRSSLTFCGIDKRFMIHLPTAPKKSKYSPEDEQILALYNAASPKMKICISLAAFHSLRRGEISALKFSDLRGDELYIHSDMVRGPHGWVHKETPKTDASNRIVYLNETELALIGSGDADEYIVGINPGGITKNFSALCKRMGLEMRFHDLRGYFSSVAAGIMPDIYTAKLGGWRENSKVLKDTYQKPIATIKEGYARKLNKHFEDMLKNG